MSRAEPSPGPAAVAGGPVGSAPRPRPDGAGARTVAGTGGAARVIDVR